MKLFRWSLFAMAGLLMLLLLGLLALHNDGYISAEVSIQASPERVWEILTDTAAYPSWNPMISSLTGELREGNVIAFTAGTGSDAMTFHPTVLAVRPPQELRWKGYVVVPGLFDGEHRFLIEPQGNEIRLTQSERFTGLLAGKLSEGILRSTKETMAEFNTALKRRAEASALLEQPTGFRPP